MPKVYVVMVEHGENSDRSVWVAAVYSTESEARTAMQAAEERRGVWNNWKQNRDRLRDAMMKERVWGWMAPFEMNDEFSAELRSKLPPEPEYERGERFQIVEVEQGCWQSRGPDEWLG